MLAAHANAVVASVDYRMAPEFKFPYAVHDCFDALKCVCSLRGEAHSRAHIEI
jgi:acetyl esterase/lipase